MAIGITRRGFVRLASGSLGAALLAGCAGGSQSQGDQGASGSKGAATAGSATAGIDYQVLVNWLHRLPDDWEARVELVEEPSPLYNDPVRVERKAYQAWLALKEELVAEGVFVELDSCYRSVAGQQEVWDEFTEEYGAEYVKTHVAQPGYSEHHTGLALDLFLVIDGKQVYENEEMVAHPEIWEKVHARLADHGFILRYLPRKAIFTHASYEPWHIRYLDDPDLARRIASAGISYEEYLGEVRPFVAGCAVDYGASQIYADADMDSALNVVLDEFGSWGCVMSRFAYAGDDACGAQELAYVNELREANQAGTSAFSQAIVFTTDFRSPSAEQAAGTAWEPDTDYRDYTWHLGRTGTDGEWQLVMWGKA